MSDVVPYVFTPYNMLVANFQASLEEADLQKITLAIRTICAEERFKNAFIKDIISEYLTREFAFAHSTHDLAMHLSAITDGKFRNATGIAQFLHALESRQFFGLRGGAYAILDVFSWYGIRLQSHADFLAIANLLARVIKPNFGREDVPANVLLPAVLRHIDQRVLPLGRLSAQVTFQRSMTTGSEHHFTVSRELMEFLLTQKEVFPSVDPTKLTLLAIKFQTRLSIAALRDLLTAAGEQRANDLYELSKDGFLGEDDIALISGLIVNPGIIVNRTKEELEEFIREWREAGRPKDVVAFEAEGAMADAWRALEMNLAQARTAQREKKKKPRVGASMSANATPAPIPFQSYIPVLTLPEQPSLNIELRESYGPDAPPLIAINAILTAVARQGRTKVSLRKTFKMCEWILSHDVFDTTLAWLEGTGVCVRRSDTIFELVRPSTSAPQARAICDALAPHIPALK